MEGHIPISDMTLKLFNVSGMRQATAITDPTLGVAGEMISEVRQFLVERTGFEIASSPHMMRLFVKIPVVFGSAEPLMVSSFL